MCSFGSTFDRVRAGCRRHLQGNLGVAPGTVSPAEACRTSCGDREAAVRVAPPRNRTDLTALIGRVEARVDQVDIHPRPPGLTAFYNVEVGLA